MAEKWEPQRLTPRHKRIMDLHLAGESNKTIATALGLTKEAVGLIINTPIFQNALSIRRDNVERDLDTQLSSTVVNARNKILASAEKAVDKLLEHVDSDNESLSLKAVNAVCDLAFGKGEGGHSITINAGSLQTLQIALAEAAGYRKERMGA